MGSMKTRWRNVRLCGFASSRCFGDGRVSFFWVLRSSHSEKKGKGKGGTVFRCALRLSVAPVRFLVESYGVGNACRLDRRFPSSDYKLHKPRAAVTAKVRRSKARALALTSLASLTGPLCAGLPDPSEASFVCACNGKRRRSDPRSLRLKS